MAYRKDWNQPQVGPMGFANNMKTIGRRVAISATDNVTANTVGAFKVPAVLGSRAMRDLKADPVMYQANRDAREREGSDPTKNNPIFTGGGLIFDGVIYLEIPEITQRLLLAGGAGGITCEPVFLLGQGALAYAMGQMPRPTTLEDGDYDFITGMGIEAQYGVGKVAKASINDSSSTLVDWGMVTGFVSGVANA